MGFLSKLWSFLKFLMLLAIVGAACYGVYWGAETGAFLKALEWLSSQDPLLLVIIAVVGLIGIAIIASVVT